MAKHKQEFPCETGAGLMALWLGIGRNQGDMHSRLLTCSAIENSHSLFFPFRLSALVAKMLLQLSAVEYLEAPQNRNEKQSTYWTPAPHQMYVLTGFPTTACLGVTTKHANTWPTASLDSLTCSFIITPL